MKELYETNEDFRDYVNKYSISRNIPVDVALTHELVRQYAIWLNRKF